MKLAVAVEGNEVADHFGRCAYYEIVKVANGQITERHRLENPGMLQARWSAYLGLWALAVLWPAPWAPGLNNSVRRCGLLRFWAYQAHSRRSSLRSRRTSW